jgi:hypothetical protein
MPELRQLEKQLRDARDSLAFAIANFGHMSTEAQAARKHLTECDSRYTCELQAHTLD